VYQFYADNIDKGKKFVAKHFLDEGVPKATVYRHIKSAEQNKPVGRKIGSGRKPHIATKPNIRKVKKWMDHKDGISGRSVARRLNCSHTWVQMILKKYTHIRFYKKTKKPDRSEYHTKIGRIKCGKIYKQYKDVHFILDDESYFTLSNNKLSGNDSFYSSDISKTPYDVKNWKCAKYEQKVLVWVAISRFGVSDPFIVRSGFSINQSVYLNQCIKKRLIPFIQKYHRRHKYLFWPDLATSHYAHTVTKYLDNQKVSYLPKLLNPANMPEVRPVEDFWAILKREVYKNGWSTKSIPNLIARIRSSLKKIDQTLVQRLMEGVVKRLDTVRRHGVP